MSAALQPPLIPFVYHMTGMRRMALAMLRLSMEDEADDELGKEAIDHSRDAQAWLVNDAALVWVDMAGLGDEVDAEDLHSWLRDGCAGVDLSARRNARRRWCGKQKAPAG